ncbi:MAG: calcium/sodium antiporter [Acholeplasmatales bacterium]|nr:calcium/sodium antiporter [Acholeplasmatales bacterium]
MIPEFYETWHIAPKLIILLVFMVVGVFFLVKFCDLFVGAASSIAKKLKIAPMIIGLTVVAMGTSCPELAVSVSDSIGCLINGGYANVAIGNVVGSNICNILLVLGLSVIFTPIIIKKSTLKKEMPFLMGVSLLLVIFGIFFGVGTVTGNYAILRWEGIIFVVLMIGYLVFLVIDAKRHPVEDENQEEIKDMKMWKAILFVVLGAIGIAAGGEFVVFGAKGLAVTGATAMGINHDLAESLVGLTIVAVGTSLPELVTSTVAAKKGQNDIALGNVIGSNIFNILFVLGIAATVNPLTTGNEIVVDLIVMMSITTLLFALAFTGKLGRKIGILFITIYVLYLTYLILRTVGVFPQL